MDIEYTGETIPLRASPLMQGMVADALSGPTEGRVCVRCDTDLTGRWGVGVLMVDDGQQFTTTDLLMCVEHGANGMNVISREEYTNLNKKE